MPFERQNHRDTEVTQSTTKRDVSPTQPKLETNAVNGKKLMPSAPANVKDLSALIVRSKLLSADDVNAALRALKPTGKDAADVEAARRLLVAGKHLTEYQAALLLRGHSEGFFLGPYKILELIAKGRMAGGYKAVHE